MKADFSRTPYASAECYQRVLSVQGAVAVDTDWNEQMSLLDRQMRRRTADLLGPFTSPDDGFRVEARSVFLCSKPSTGFHVAHSGKLLAGEHTAFTLECALCHREGSQGTLITRESDAGELCLRLALDETGILTFDYTPTGKGGHAKTISLSSPQSLPKDAWLYVRIVLSRNTLALWIDDRCVSSSPARHALALGHGPWRLCADAQGEKPFQGLIHSIAIYDQARSRRHRTRSPDNIGALAFWSAETLEHHDLTDSSGHGHHASSETSALALQRSEQLVLSKGSVYLDGMRCSNPTCMLLDPPEHVTPNALIVLEAWEYLVSAIDDARLADPGLEQADAAVRVALGTHPRWLALPSDRPAYDLTHAEADRLLEDHLPIRGHLLARRKNRLSTLENHLYRIEVHTVPTDTAPGFFKWSRDNASFAVGVQSLSSPTNTVTLNPFSERSTLLPNSVVEWTDTQTIRLNVPGTLLNLQSFNAETNALTCGSLTGIEMAPGARIIAWDHQPSSPVDSLGVAFKPGAWIPVEEGIEVFFTEQGAFGPGDYWNFAARESTGNIDWPTSDLGPESLPPFNEVLREPLAIVKRHDGKAHVLANFCARFTQLGQREVHTTKIQELDLILDTKDGEMMIEMREVDQIVENGNLTEEVLRITQELILLPSNPVATIFRLEEHPFPPPWEAGSEHLDRIVSAAAHGQTLYLLDEAGLIASSAGSKTSFRSYKLPPEAHLKSNAASATLVATEHRLWVVTTESSQRIFCLELDSGEWREFPSPTEHQPGAAVIALKDALLLIGGTRLSLLGRRSVPLVQRLDITRQQWSVESPLNYPRSRITMLHTAAGLVALGGVTYPRPGLVTRPSGAQEIFSPDKTWSDLPPLPPGLRVLCAFDHGDRRHAYCMRARDKRVIERHTCSNADNSWWLAGTQPCDTPNSILVPISSAVLAVRRSIAGDGPRVVSLASLVRSHTQEWPA